jgi:hypothetical protein
MQGATKNFIGLEGFVWWLGVVEDRQDPEQLGRVRVRCFGWHTADKKMIPTDSLPWAHPVIPVNSPQAYTPKEGDMVFGFFVDGVNAQNPMIMGILPGKPAAKPNYENGFSDPGTNLDGRPTKPADSKEKYPKTRYVNEPTQTRLARGKSEGTVIATRNRNTKKGVRSAGEITWSEPAPPFAPKYPYNNALETESGHALEFDDTPGNERVHLAHRSGAYIEFDKNGSRVDRVQKDNYTVVMGDDYIYISGKAAITVDGNFNLRTSTINIQASEINMASDGAVKIKGSSVKIESTGSMDLKAGKSGKFTAAGRLDLKGATAGLGGATVDIPAGKVNLQSGSVSEASGTGLKGGGTSGSTAVAPEAEVPVNLEASANSVGTAPSPSSLEAGIDPTKNPDNLEEVVVTSKKVTANTVGNVVTKNKSGLTRTLNKVADALVHAADSIIQQFANKLPSKQIKNSVADFTDLANQNKSSLLALEVSVKENVFGKIDEISKLSYAENIEFKLEPEIQKDMLNLLYDYNSNKTTNIFAKRPYPRTETIASNNKKSAEQYKEVLTRYAAQNADKLG